MKLLSTKNTIVIILIALAGSLAIIPGCVKQKFDVPPINVPDPGLVANTTIDSLRKNFVPDTIGMMTIKTDIIIEGIVGGDDESGNIYKSLYLQDNTAGISISLDQYDLYTSYPVGQKLFIKCKGLYLGQYGTAIQIGYPYNGQIGRIPQAMIAEHVFPSGLPGQEPSPIVLNAGHLSTSLLNKYLSMLIQVNSVKFPDAGQPFVKTNESYTSRNVADSSGTLTNPLLILYTSKYADFHATLLPTGVGTLKGILTIYNGKYEVLVRDSTDLINFSGKK